ncbi:MAG: hypothetical protein LBV80_10940 [Deltaproteobacteria bacterium]|jgi:hypothetical protein|nr:hypothetical protein [Deltaproteobacteria bacterium]
MPKFYTKDFEDKALYFDLRNNGTGEPEGIRARPIFADKELELECKCLCEGRLDQLWVELLAYALKGWEGFYDVTGEIILYSEDNLRQLCNSAPEYMRALLCIIRTPALARVNSPHDDSAYPFTY